MGLGGRAGRKLAAQAAGAGGAGADFDMLSQLMGDAGRARRPFPGLPAPAAARPVVSANKGTKKKKKGGPGHPAERPVGPASVRMDATKSR